jgi:hypothetical protein
MGRNREGILNDGAALSVGVGNLLKPGNAGSLCIRFTGFYRIELFGKKEALNMDILGSRFKRPEAVAVPKASSLVSPVPQGSEVWRKLRTLNGHTSP